MVKARARFLPTVNFNETYNFSDSSFEVFMSKLNQWVSPARTSSNNLNNPNAYGNFRTGLAMRQPLFQAGEGAPGLSASPDRPGMAAATS